MLSQYTTETAGQLVFVCAAKKLSVLVKGYLEHYFNNNGLHREFQLFPKNSYISAV